MSDQDYDIDCSQIELDAAGHIVVPPSDFLKRIDHFTDVLGTVKGMGDVASLLIRCRQEIEYGWQQIAALKQMNEEKFRSAQADEIARLKSTVDGSAIELAEAADQIEWGWRDDYRRINAATKAYRAARRHSGVV